MHPWWCRVCCNGTHTKAVLTVLDSSFSSRVHQRRRYSPAQRNLAFCCVCFPDLAMSVPLFVDWSLYASHEPAIVESHTSSIRGRPRHLYWVGDVDSYVEIIRCWLATGLKKEGEIGMIKNGRFCYSFNCWHIGSRLVLESLVTRLMVLGCACCHWKSTDFWVEWAI